MSENEKPKTRGGRTWAFFGGLALLVVVSGAVWYFVVVRPAQSAAEGTMAKVEKFFGDLLGSGSKITRNDNSSLLQVSEVGELALMEFDLKVSKEIEDEQVTLHLLTSKKTLRMAGEFKVKIGYDITGGLSVFYDENGKAVISGLKGPQVLSAEMISVTTLEDTSGWWNKVNKEDRDALTNELRLQAIRDVKESGMLEQMDSLMRSQMKSLLGVEDMTVQEEMVLP